MSNDRTFALGASALLVASLALNLFQAHRIASLAAGRSAALPVTLANVAKEGTSVSSLRLKDPSGKEAAVSYGATPKATVLYVMSPSCMWCRRNEECIRYLAQHAGQQYKFVGISLDSVGLADYLNNLGSQPTGTWPST